LRDTPKAPFLQEIGNTDSNQVVCGIQAPQRSYGCAYPLSLKTYPPKQVALSQNGAFPDYYRWVWYFILHLYFYTGFFLSSLVLLYRPFGRFARGVQKRDKK
jgi:hypothetical protein